MLKLACICLQHRDMTFGSTLGFSAEVRFCTRGFIHAMLSCAYLCVSYRLSCLIVLYMMEALWQHWIGLSGVGYGKKMSLKSLSLVRSDSYCSVFGVT